MARLLNSEFHRLLHFKLYIIECATAILFSLCMMFMDQTQQPAVDGSLFRIMVIFGYLSTCCISQFIGIEYSCGTIRNKLFVGHTRTEIYFTQLILHFLASVNVLNLSVVTAVISGAICSRQYDSSFIELFCCYLMCVCTIFLFTAITVLVSMLNSSNMASFIILIVMGLALQIFGSDFTSKLSEPEIRMPYDFEIAEGQTAPIENSLYVAESDRSLYEHLVAANPYGQANYEFEPMYDRYVEYKSSKIMESPLIKIFLYSAAESAILIFIGLSAFKKKEIK